MAIKVTNGAALREERDAKDGLQVLDGSKRLLVGDGLA
jgi:hypothetical protein